MVPTKYWHVLENGKVQCDLCPRECQLRNGQHGMCFIRACQDDAIVLTSYGRSTGFCVDPIEKKPLYHFLPGSFVLSFGTAGCNLACKFCQNWDISKSREFERLSAEAQPAEIAAAALENSCKSVSFTYNDPVISLEYAVETAAACREAGIKSVAVTAGYIQGKAREDFFAPMDAANVDLKGFSEDFYRRLCAGHLQPVLDTLVYIKQHTNVWLEITTLLIPGENDSPEELEQLSRWVVENLGRDVPMHFTVFHPAYKLQDKLPTPRRTLALATQLARDCGMNYVYTGNIEDDVRSGTYCTHCGKRIVSRSWHSVDEYHLDAQGHCSFCGTRCAGVFEASAAQINGGLPR